MGAQEEVVLRIRGIMETGDIRSAVKEIEGYFGKMNLSKGMKGEFDGIFDKLLKEVDNFEEKAQSSFKKASDVSALEKSAGKIEGLFDKMIQSMTKLDGMDIEDLVNIDTSEIKKFSEEIEKLEKKVKELTSQKLDFGADAFKGISKSGQIGEFFKNFESGKIDQAGVSLKALQQNVLAFSTSIQGSEQDVKKAKEAMERYADALQSGDFDKIRTAILNLDEALKKTGDTSNLSKFVTRVNDMTQAWAEAKDEVKQTTAEIQRLEARKVDATADAVARAAQQWTDMKTSVKGTSENVRDYASATVNAATRTNELNNEMSEIKNRVKYFLSLENAVDLFRQGVRKAFETVKELDKAMTETAVVTDFKVGDMWDQLPKYSQMAKELGVSMQGVYEASTLYYQQGLKQEEVMSLTTETLKMARIAGLEYADATDLMTAALRGFNMEINEASAQRVNDVYSELAAITAADTNEIATAMTKTASIANSANMELETTAALLAQMIETTREPAETAGTAMKTIVARFTEMKKAVGDVVTVEGEEVSVNKVETALKTAGVALRDTKGEFRNLDDVFLDLAKRWNSLDIMTQRYIATTAAGSRQQSRFIAMMQDYDRTMELVDAAYNSAGASTQQFTKTQDSLESKLANLETAWQEFLMGISNSDAIKRIVDALTMLLETINKASTGVSGFSTFVLRMFTVITTLKVGKGIFARLFSGIGSQMQLGGQQAGTQFTTGMLQSTQQGTQTLGARLKSDLKTLFSGGAFKSSLKSISKEVGDSIGAVNFAEKLENSMNFNQIQAKAPQIAEMMQSSLGAALNQNNLTQEGQKWADGLIKSFQQRIQSGEMTAKQAVEALEQEVDTGLNSDKVGQYFKNGEDGAAEAVMNLDTQYNGKKELTSHLQIPKETLKDAKKLKVSMDGVGMAISGVGMSLNLITSGFQEAGLISEDTAKSIESVSSGLSTAGTLLMTLTSLQKMFNISAAANPWLAVGAALIGILTTVGSIIKKNAEEEKKLHENTIDEADKNREKVKSLEELSSKQKDLLETYEKTGENEEELKEASDELREFLEEEGIAVENLTNNYRALAEAAEEAFQKRNNENITIQQGAQGSAMGLAATEGKFSFGKAGFGNSGSEYEMHLGAKDSFEELQSIIDSLKGKYNLDNIKVTQDSLDKNLKVTGINSDEDRYQYGLLLQEAMGQYLTDYLYKNDYSSSDSSAYMGYTNWWGNVSSYYETYGVAKGSAEESAVKSLETEMQNEYGNKQYESYDDYRKDVQTLIEAYSEDKRFSNFTPEQLEGIITTALGKASSSAKGLSTVDSLYSKQLSGSNGANWKNFFSGLTDYELSLVGTLDLEINEDTLISDVQKALAKKKYEIALEGDKIVGDSAVSYAQKMVSGEELTEEDKAAVGAALASNPNTTYYAQQWSEVSQKDNATQLEFLSEATSVARAQASNNRTELMKGLVVDDLVVTDAEISAHEKEKSDKRKLEEDNARLKGNINITQLELNNLNEKQKAAGQAAKDNAAENVMLGVSETLLGLGNMVMGAGITAGTLGTASPLGLLQGGAGIMGAVDGLTRIVNNANGDAAANAAMATYDQQIADQQSTLERNKATLETNQSKIDEIEAQQNTLAGKMAEANIQLFTEDEIKNKKADTPDEVYNRVKEYGQWMDQYSAIATMSQESNFNNSRAEGELLNTAGLKELAASDALGNIDFNNLSQMRSEVASITKFTDAQKEDYLRSIDAEEERRQVITEMGVEVKDWSKTDDILKQLKEKKDELEGKLNIDTSESSDNLEEVQNQIEVLNDTIESIDAIEIQIEKAELDAAMNEMELLAAQMQNLNAATALIDPDTFQVDLSAFQQLRQLYPDLLEGHKVLSNGMIQLNKDTVDSVVNGVKDAAEASSKGTIAAKKVELQAQKETLQGMLKGEASKENVKNTTSKAIATIAAQQAKDESEAATTAANTAGEASAHASGEIIKNMGSVAAATDALGAKIDSLNGALAGSPYEGAKTASDVFKVEGVHTDFSPTTKPPTAEEISASYDANQNWLANYNKYTQENDGDDQSFAEWMAGQTGATDAEKQAAIDLYNNISDAIDATDQELLDLTELEAMFNSEFSKLGTIGDKEKGKGGGGGTKEQEEKNALKEREEELTRQINEELEKAAPNYEKVNALMRERDNLQFNYLDSLKDEEAQIEKNIQKQIEKNEKAGMSDYFNVEKDGETYTVVFTDKYADLTSEQKEKVDKYYAETVEVIAKDAVIQAEIDRLNKEGKVELGDGSWVDPDRAQKDYEADLNNTLEDQEDLERTLSGLQDDQVKNYPLILAYQARQIALKKKEVAEAKRLLELEKAKMKAKMAAMEVEGYSKYAGYDLEKEQLYYNSELIQQDLDSGVIDEGYVQNIDTYYDSLKPGAESIDNYQDMVDDGNAEIQAMAEEMVNTAMEMVSQIVDIIVKVADFISEIAAGIKDALLGAITDQEFWLENTFRRMEALMSKQERLLTKNEQVQSGLLSTVTDMNKNYAERWNNLQKQYITAKNIVTDTEEYLNRNLSTSLANFGSSIKDLLGGKEAIEEAKKGDGILGKVGGFFRGLTADIADVATSAGTLILDSLTTSWTTEYSELFGALETDPNKELSLNLALGLMSNNTLLGPLADTLQTIQEHSEETLEAAYDAHEEYTDKMLELEQQMLEMVKEGVEEATAFEESVMEAYTAQKQAEIDELSRLNDSISNANSALISTLQDNLSKMREERELDKTKEDISDKERRLAYLRQDTSGANKIEILKLEEELEDSRESYTDKLIDKKINELQEQNDKAAEQRQYQIDLLQSQLDYSVKYGLYWKVVQETLLDNSNNFDSRGYVAKNSDLAKLLSTYGSTEILSKSIWGATVAREAFELAGLNYKSFIARNPQAGVWNLSNVLENLDQLSSGVYLDDNASIIKDPAVLQQYGKNTALYASNIAKALGISEQDLNLNTNALLASGAITASLVQGVADTISEWLPIFMQMAETAMSMATSLLELPAIATTLLGIASEVGIIAGFSAIPGYAVGTPFLKQDTLAMVHKGEMIIPARYNPENNPNVGLVSKGLLVGESAHTAAAQKNLTTQNNREISQNVNIIIEEINENVDVDMVIQKITDTLNSNLRYITNI